MANSDPSNLVPALRFRWLTSSYDRIMRFTLKEHHLKSLLIDQANVEPRFRVVDVGCGTGTLTIMLKTRHPESKVIGVDADQDALNIAIKKTEQSNATIEFICSLADEVPIEPASIDRAVSSLFFHHLETEVKRKVLRKLFSLIRPDGELHILDWGKAQNTLMRIAFLSVQLLDGFSRTSDNVRGELVALIQESGFADVQETHREATIFGTVSLYRAIRPNPSL